MDEDPFKKATLVTGASMGIGLELAKLFATKGHNLVLVARSAEKLEAIAREFREKYGVFVKVVAKDLVKAESPQEIFAELAAETIVIENLVNNAGYANYGEFSETGLSVELDMIRLNISALTELTKLFLRDMRKRGEGRILNVASTAAFQPGPLMAVYYASKAYVLSFTEAIREELRGSGVSVTVLCPGPTRTNFQVRADVLDLRLLKMSNMNADTVARKAYRGLMRGQALVVPGLFNKFTVFSVRLAPRALVRWVVMQISKRVKH